VEGGARRRTLSPSPILILSIYLSCRFVTFLAAAGRPGIDEELKKGAVIGTKTYKVHLDGYNQLDYLMGECGERRET